MMRDLHEKHVVITGASSGIGAALARELARSGARLTLVARRRDHLERLAADCAASCHALAVDLSEVPPLDWLDGARSRLGPVDVLVNNAGMENTGPITDSDVEVGRRLLRLNLETPLVITRRLLAELANQRGAIVNVASVAALAPAPLQAWYGASKAGLASFSESLRGELRAEGIDVLTVYPGPVKTPMADAAYAALGGRKGLVGLAPEGRPEELARRIVAALERGSSRLIYPSAYSLAWFVPWFARWLKDQALPGSSPRLPQASDLR
jgi:short-subunit dehydrogenase